MSYLAKYYFRVVVILSFIIAAWFAVTLYYINPWPTDSWTLYIPAAKDLQNMHYISEMHILNKICSLYNKETLIAGIAVFQHLLHDFDSLYPNMLLLIVSVFVSSVLIYLIFQKWFSPAIGLLAFFLFSASFWSYIYVLQGAHQPLALMNFLVAVYFITVNRTAVVQYLLAGISLGLMFFSSPTAPLYAPYLIVAFLFEIYRRQLSDRKILQASALMTLGFMYIVLLVTLPYPLDALKNYLDFVHYAKTHTNFPHAAGEIGGRGDAGITWIFKYFLMSMPVVFLSYSFCLVYLLFHARRNTMLLVFILLSLTTPLQVELSQSAQFGRNYYSWHIGMIFLICFSVYHFLKLYFRTMPIRSQRLIQLLFVTFIATYIFTNAKILFADLLPSRMFTNTFYSWLHHHPAPVFAYRQNPYSLYAGDNVNNPKYAEPIPLQKIDFIKDAKSGWILIPPMTGKNIYTNCQGKNFVYDPYLMELLTSGEFEHYVAASYPTIGSSVTWNQEEEYCSYLDLHLGKISADDRWLSRMFILDAAKLQREWFGKGHGNFEAKLQLIK